jgi:hypothetical protein
MEQKKVLKITMAFLAIKSFIVGAFVIMAAISLAAVVGLMAAIPGATGAATGMNMVIVVMWIIGIVEILLGLCAVVSAVVIKK